MTSMDYIDDIKQEFDTSEIKEFLEDSKEFDLSTQELEDSFVCSSIKPEWNADVEPEEITSAEILRDIKQENVEFKEIFEDPNEVDDTPQKMDDENNKNIGKEENPSTPGDELRNSVKDGNNATFMATKFGDKMFSEEELMLMALGLVAADEADSQKDRKPRSKWVKESSKSHISLLNELREEPQEWRNCLRMDEQTYEQLLQCVSPYIEKEDTIMRKAITPHERLSATLRFLATGQSYQELTFSTRISPQSLGKLIPETCSAIRKALTKDFMKFPTTQEEWLQIAHTFDAKWNFPNCLGAVDGKHVRISAKATDGAYYRNYKGFDSMVLMAIVDANYEFIMCDFGINGRISDGGVIKETSFYKMLINNQLNIPPPRNVNNSELPFVFIGDEAFSLRNDFLKPFSQRELNHERKMFNYRLSRARNVVENTFGILASRFRIFHTTLRVKYEYCEEIVMACCVLHNFLRRTKKDMYTEMPSEIDAEIANSLVRLDRGHSRHASDANQTTRELFKQYFCNEGAVPFQEDVIARNYY